MEKNASTNLLGWQGELFPQPTDFTVAQTPKSPPAAVIVDAEKSAQSRMLAEPGKFVTSRN
ncbi:MAG: hypothetical protein ACR2HE_11700 [Casimicrobiaceae bacterium]